MSELKSAKTFGADDKRPFSDNTVRRLWRIEDELEGRREERALSRSDADSVGFSGGVSALRFEQGRCGKQRRGRGVGRLTDESGDFGIISNLLVERLNILRKPVELFLRFFQGREIGRCSVCAGE